MIMKTNNVIIRPMGEFQVQQRTKDGMFNATVLQKQWNDYVENLDEGNSLHLKKKDLREFFSNNATNEFIETLMKKENLKERNSVYVKSRARADRGGGTWMHPFLFIDFAMWLNPSFKYEVLKFVYDQMIKYRNEAGDAYRDLSASVYKIVDTSRMSMLMSQISKGINFVVFGEHRPAIRNDKGTEEDQRKLYEMERKVSSLINEGFLKSYDEVMDYLRRRYRERNMPVVFQ